MGHFSDICYDDEYREDTLITLKYCTRSEEYG